MEKIRYRVERKYGKYWSTVTENHELELAKSVIDNQKEEDKNKYRILKVTIKEEVL